MIQLSKFKNLNIVWPEDHPEIRYGEVYIFNWRHIDTACPRFNYRRNGIFQINHIISESIPEHNIVVQTNITTNTKKVFHNGVQLDESKGEYEFINDNLSLNFNMIERNHY